MNSLRSLLPAAFLAACALPVAAADFSLNQANFVSGNGSAVIASWGSNDAPTKDWIGLYRAGQVPGGPVSTRWWYAETESGTREVIANANNTWLGNWFVGYFNNDGYTLVPGTSFQPFSVAAPAGLTVTPTLAQFGEGQGIEVGWAGNVGFVATDWLAIYPAGATVNNQYVAWQYAGAASGTGSFTALPIGNYDVYLLAADGYNQLGMASFSVVPEPATGALLALGLGLLFARRRA